MKFQSTHSLRSATKDGETLTGAVYVSIHALLAECDAGGQVAFRPVHRFNPRTPCGVRPSTGATLRNNRKFQSTHSLRSATSKYTGACHEYAVSIHALLAECDNRQLAG